jgi:acyl-CoA hydrolase
MQVTAIFETSLEVMVSVCAETPQVGEVFHCADAYATVVVVDHNCRPMVSSYYVEPVTEAQRLRHQVSVLTGI